MKTKIFLMVILIPIFSIGAPKKRKTTQEDIKDVCAKVALHGYGLKIEEEDRWARCIDNDNIIYQVLGGTKTNPAILDYFDKRYYDKIKLTHDFVEGQIKACTIEIIREVDLDEQGIHVYTWATKSLDCEE